MNNDKSIICNGYAIFILRKMTFYTWLGGWGMVGEWLGGWGIVGAWLEHGWSMVEWLGVVGAWLEHCWVVGGWLEDGWSMTFYTFFTNMKQ